MTRKLVTCPETGHLEQLDLEETRLGLVVVGCSRFRGETLSCPRECTRRLDLRERREVDLRDRILIVVEDLERESGKLAFMLARSLGAEQFCVELAAISSHSPPPLADYDAVVVGAAVDGGHLERSVVEYIREHAEELGSMPAFFFTLGAPNGFGEGAMDTRMTRQTGWVPTGSAAFADASASQGADVGVFALLIGDEMPDTSPAAPS